MSQKTEKPVLSGQRIKTRKRGKKTGLKIAKDSSLFNFMLNLGSQITELGVTAHLE